jgi:chemotaxis protein methyltransferase CheR
VADQEGKSGPGLRGRFREGDADQRYQVIADLDPAHDPEALDLLIGALGDDSWRVRKLASDRLTTWPNPSSVVRSLVRVLTETSVVGLRNGAIDALTRIGTSSVAELVGALRRRPEHRKFLIDALGSIGEPSAVSGLVACLSDQDTNVRVAAAEALGKIGGDEAAAALLQLADSDDMLLQLTALDGLAEMGAVVAVDKLVRWVDVPVVRCSALRLLGRSRDLTALPLLVAAIADKTRRAREAAIEAVARLTDTEMTQADQATVEVALRSLDQAAVDQVANALGARDPAVRRAAAFILGFGSHRSAVAELTAGLGDPETGPAFARAIEVLAPAVTPSGEQAGSAKGQVISMSAEEFAGLRRHVERICGVCFPDDGAYLLRRRVAPRLAATGCTSFAEYLRLVASGRDHAENQQLIDRVTTNETYFFRETYQLRAFRDELLPLLRKLRAGRRSLRVWSAGCSTGEEAYTIAMIMVEDPGLRGWAVEVVGTDISERVIELAKQGVYSERSVRSREFHELHRFLRRSHSGDYEVTEGLRELVRFERMNLLDETSVLRLGPVDVIFCRNVLMYFGKATRRRAVQTFYRRLNPGGFLLLGHSDSLINLSTAFELKQLRNDTVYRKPI